MEKDLKNIQPKPQPRDFGVALMTVLGLLALLKGLKTGATPLVLLGAMGVTLIFFLFWPEGFRPPMMLSQKLTDRLSPIVNGIFLSLFYYCFITPIAISYRWFSKDSFSQRQKSPSSWETPSEQDTDLSRQF